MGLRRWTRTFDRLMTSREETRPRERRELRLTNVSSERDLARYAYNSCHVISRVRLSLGAVSCQST